MWSKLPFQGLTPMLRTLPPSAPLFARHDMKLRQYKQRCAHVKVHEVHHPEHSWKPNFILTSANTSAKTSWTVKSQVQGFFWVPVTAMFTSHNVWSNHRFSRAYLRSPDMEVLNRPQNWWALSVGYCHLPYLATGQGKLQNTTLHLMWF